MIFFICFLLTLDVTYSLYFELAEYEKLKFIVDASKSKKVVGNYTCEIKKRNSHQMKISSTESCFSVQVYDPTQKMVFSKWYGASGKFTFQSHLAGEHSIVVLPPRDLQFQYDDAVARIHLKLVSGEDFQKMKQYEHLNAIETTFRQLIEQVKDIQKEQDYQRYRETNYRMLSEKISISVISFAGAQICILIIVITLQIKHLKSFLKHDKLI